VPEHTATCFPRSLLVFRTVIKGSEVYSTDWLAFLHTGRISKDEYYQGLVFSYVDVIAKAAFGVPFTLVKAQRATARWF